MRHSKCAICRLNHRRLLEPIGDMPPAELEQAYYRQLEESAMAA